MQKKHRSGSVGPIIVQMVGKNRKWAAVQNNRPAQNKALWDAFGFQGRFSAAGGSRGFQTRFYDHAKYLVMLRLAYFRMHPRIYTLSPTKR
jgi:hypothetical protein